jgi:hypothetical protein
MVAQVVTHKVLRGLPAKVIPVAMAALTQIALLPKAQVEAVVLAVLALIFLELMAAQVAQVHLRQLVALL